MFYNSCLSDQNSQRTKRIFARTYDCWTNPIQVFGRSVICVLIVQVLPHGHMHEVREGTLKFTNFFRLFISRREN
jgi:hypothetical protein